MNPGSSADGCVESQVVGGWTEACLPDAKAISKPSTADLPALSITQWTTVPNAVMQSPYGFLAPCDAVVSCCFGTLECDEREGNWFANQVTFTQALGGITAFAHVERSGMLSNTLFVAGGLGPHAK